MVLGLDIAPRQHRPHPGQFKRLTQRLAHGAVVIDQKHAVNAHAAFLPGFAASRRITNSAPPPGRFSPAMSPPKPLTMP